MLVRIVKMSFCPEKIATFYEIFQENKVQVRSFSGNTFLELYRDKHNKSVVFTYSVWQDEQCLEDYRNSEFFRGFWNSIKPLFNDKPEAWSLMKLETVEVKSEI